MKRWMMTAILAVVAVAPSDAGAQEPLIVGAERFLRLEWQQSQDRKGRSVVEGYVYNDTGRPVEHLRLLVDALDQSGARVASAIGPVAGVVPNNSRAYFSVKAPAGGASYRVRIYSYDWTGGQR